MQEQEPNKKLSFFDLAVLILSTYVLIALLVDSFFVLPTEISRLLTLIDNAICFVFIFDFLQRLFTARSKLEYLKWGWIDLISSIPTVDYLRFGRFVRLLRILRVLRAFRSLKFIVNHLFKNRTQATFASVSLIAVLMIIFGSISLLQVEQDPNSNIKTAEDAIWWAFVTITTVGYGDKYPVTTEGRIIAAFLMVTGVGLFGTFTGYMTSWFVGNQRRDKNES
ncbi:MAG: potassium channel family protein [Bacteroidetes bacterium]|nr:potassium channel family protein [Bacteroidota bacterium]